MRSVFAVAGMVVFCFGLSCNLAEVGSSGDSTGQVDRSIILAGKYAGTVQTKIFESLDGVDVIDKTVSLYIDCSFDAAGILMSIDGTTAIYEGFTEVAQDSTTMLEITYTKVSLVTGGLEVEGDATMTLTESGSQRVLTGSVGSSFMINASGDLVITQRMDFGATTATGHVFRAQDTDGTLTLQ